MVLLAIYVNEIWNDEKSQAVEVPSSMIFRRAYGGRISFEEVLEVQEAALKTMT